MVNLVWYVFSTYPKTSMSTILLMQMFSYI